MILIVLLGTIHACGQRLKPNSIIKANRTTFKIEEIKTIDASVSNYVTVANVNNTFHGRKPKVYMDPMDLYGTIEKGSMLKAFMQVFNDDRLKQLAATDRGIDVSLYITPAGKVSEVSFMLRKNTLLTTAELEALENAIKNNVFFNLRPAQTKGSDFFSIDVVVKYRNVLNRIER